MKVSILGIGAFGIALTKIIKKDIKISMWTNFEDELKSVELKRENPIVLPGVKIDSKIELTTDMKKSVKNADVIFIAVPAVAVREVSNLLKDHITKEQTICILTKGIEKTTNMFMFDIVKETINTENICILAGPSFAVDVASAANIGISLASENDDQKQKVENVLSNANLCITKTTDVIGVEISSAIKNIFAIICGMVDGKKESDSTKAAVLTILLNDFRLAMGVLGGRETTIYSFAGIGDFLLTCMCSKSRNYSFGKLLGQGMNLQEALNNMQVKTIEGLYTLDATYDILKKKQVKINSINLIYDVIYNDKKVDNLLKEIWS